MEVLKAFGDLIIRSGYCFSFIKSPFLTLETPVWGVLVYIIYVYNLVCDSGETALMLAAEEGHIKIVEYLITKNASLFKENDWGKRVIFIYTSDIFYYLMYPVLDKEAVAEFQVRSDFSFPGPS